MDQENCLRFSQKHITRAWFLTRKGKLDASDLYASGFHYCANLEVVT